MPWTISIDKKHYIAEVINTDAVTFEGAIANSKKVLNFCRANEIDCLLIDLSAAKMQLTTPQVYDLPQIYEDLGIPRAMKSAIVMPRQMEVSDNNDFLFYETITRNRGFRVKLFGNREDAVGWLTADRILAADRFASMPNPEYRI